MQTLVDWAINCCKSVNWLNCLSGTTKAISFLFFFAKWWWFFMFFSIAFTPLIIAILLFCFSRLTPLCFFFLFNKRHPYNVELGFLRAMKRRMALDWLMAVVSLRRSAGSFVPTICWVALSRMSASTRLSSTPANLAVMRHLRTWKSSRSPTRR